MKAHHVRSVQQLETSLGHLVPGVKAGLHNEVQQREHHVQIQVLADRPRQIILARPRAYRGAVGEHRVLLLLLLLCVHT